MGAGKGTILISITMETWSPFTNQGGGTGWDPHPMEIRQVPTYILNYLNNLKYMYTTTYTQILVGIFMIWIFIIAFYDYNFY